MISTARRFTDAFLREEAPSATSLLARTATFHSPVRDYVGADRITEVWRAVAGILTDVQPTSVHERDGEAIAFFVGTVRDQPVDGVLRTLTGEDNCVTNVTLMVRPWAALKAGLADVRV